MKQSVKNRDAGFTLIELLVVIAVIGLLATIVMVSLNSARKKARNTKRNADNVQLKTAFNMAADAAGGVFPSTGSDAWNCVSTSCYGGWAPYGANATIDAAIAPYIKKPEDPAESSRGYGGYMYDGAWAGGTGYDGTVYPAGAYLAYTLESVTIANGVCGQGLAWSTNSSFIQCMLKID